MRGNNDERSTSLTRRAAVRSGQMFKDAFIPQDQSLAHQARAVAGVGAIAGGAVGLGLLGESYAMPMIGDAFNATGLPLGIGAVASVGLVTAVSGIIRASERGSFDPEDVRAASRDFFRFCGAGGVVLGAVAGASALVLGASGAEHVLLDVAEISGVAGAASLVAGQAWNRRVKRIDGPAVG